MRHMVKTLTGRLFLFLFALCALVIITGCDRFDADPGAWVDEQLDRWRNENPADMPSAAPPQGTYTGAQSVTLSTATSGAAIYYTLDGSPPDTAKIRYAGPFTVETGTTLKAFAIRTGMGGSPVMTANYTQAGTAVKPVADPAGGIYATAKNVTLSTRTDGASIYYTLDGSDPGQANGTLYSGAFEVSMSAIPGTILKAVAVKSGLLDSAMMTETYIQLRTVTFESNGGNVIDTQDVADGGTVTAPAAPSKTGHDFGGWYSNSGLTTAYDFSTPVSADITLYAKWIVGSEAEFARTYYATLAGAISVASGSSGSPSVITILRDIDITAATSLDSGKHIKLTVPTNATHVIKRGGTYTGSLFTVPSGASLTLEGNGTGEMVMDGGAVWSTDVPATRTSSGLTATASLITVSGTLVINSGAVLQNNVNTGTGGGVTITSGGTATLSGGTIKANQAETGGGFYINVGTLTFNSGTISANTGTSNSHTAGGGGIHVTGTAEVTRGIVTLSDGAFIEDNYMTGATYGWGAGIQIGAFGTVNMQGGVIRRNLGGSGAGIDLVAATSILNMSGGTIGGSSADGNIASGHTYNEGGGVHKEYGTFIMSGGTISGNTATGGGGASFHGSYSGTGEYSDGSTFTSTSATLTGH